MNQSMKIQMDIKNNAQDLQDYVLDLKNWEKEMKEKENELTNSKMPHRDFPPPRNKIKRNKSENEKFKINSKAKKISGYDYSAWDKYDADKACDELDSDEANSLNSTNNNLSTKNIEDIEAGNDNDESEDNDDEGYEQDKLSLIDQAVYQKELGNQHVKKEEWNAAIKCYTQAIQLDSKNPIYYSNRSLCFLKLKNFRASEVDATTALQLDKSYVKAYQRRAYARLALGQLVEAKADFEEVLKIEPKNSLMSLELNKINEKLKKLNKTESKSTFNHKNLFKKEISKSNLKATDQTTTQMQQGTVQKNQLKSDQKNLASESSLVNSEKFLNNLETVKKNIRESNENKELDVKEESFKFKDLPPNCKIVEPVQIPPHKRSKEPLKIIPVIEIFSEPDLSKTADQFNSQNSNESVVYPEKKEVVEDTLKVEEKSKKIYEDEKYTLDEPKMFVQFSSNWKVIRKHPEDACKYLKKIADKLPQIFGDSLESDLFSDLIKFLAFDCPRNELTTIYLLLLNLSKVKRFTSITLFMSKEDKESIKKCITALKKVKSEKEISDLFTLYAL